MNKNLIAIAFLSTIIMTVNNKAFAQDKGQYANINGIKMYYEIYGTGQPLVLIHGGGSTLHTSFGKIIPLLSKTYKVIGVELQGHGHTSHRDEPETFEQDADDVAELLKQLNIKGAHIIGFSNGGNTAMQVAIRHPERVSKLVLASAFYKREGMYSWFWEGMKNSKLEDMPKVYQDEYLRINNSQAGLQKMFLNDATRMQTFKDWKDEDLKSIKAPSLLIIGDKDVVRPEHAVAMYRLFPYGRLAIIPGTHGSYLGEVMSLNPDSKVPHLFMAMVEEYLEEPIPDSR